MKFTSKEVLPVSVTVVTLSLSLSLSLSQLIAHIADSVQSLTASQLSLSLSLSQLIAQIASKSLIQPVPWPSKIKTSNVLLSTSLPSAFIRTTSGVSVILPHFLIAGHV